MRASITSTFTGVSVSRMDIEPVAIEAFACSSSEALRPSQPTTFVSAWPSARSGCDLREVNFPESLRLFASRGSPSKVGQMTGAAGGLTRGRQPPVPKQLPPELDER